MAPRHPVDHQAHGQPPGRRTSTRRAPHGGLVGPAPAARQHHQALRETVPGRPRDGPGVDDGVDVDRRPRRHCAQRQRRRTGRAPPRTGAGPDPRGPRGRSCSWSGTTTRQEDRSLGAGRTRPRDRNPGGRHRSAAGADARPDGRGAAGLGEPARPHPQQGAAADDAAHERVRRADGLPAHPAGEPGDIREAPVGRRGAQRSDHGRPDPEAGPRPRTSGAWSPSSATGTTCPTASTACAGCSPPATRRAALSAPRCGFSRLR